MNKSEWLLDTLLKKFIVNLHLIPAEECPIIAENHELFLKMCSNANLSLKLQRVKNLDVQSFYISIYFSSKLALIYLAFHNLK